MLKTTKPRLIIYLSLLLASNANYAANPLCVLHLKFDDGTGFDTTLDSSGSNNDGVLINMDPNTDWVAGVTSDVGDFSLDLDGINDYVVVPDDDSLDFGADDFTVAYWFNKHPTSNLTGSGLSKWRTINNPGSSEWTLNPSYGFPQVHRASFYVEIGLIVYSINSPNTFSLNEWHHLAGVRSGNTLSLYVDGVLEAFRDDLPIDAVINNTDAELRVGNNQPPAALFPTDGQFDDVQVYRFAATDGGITVGETATEQIGFMYNNPGIQLQTCVTEPFIFSNGFEE